jgi:protein O-mannosyl-transferase
LQDHGLHMTMGRKFFLALAMALAAAWIYWPAMHGGWIWDDKNELAQMAGLRGLAGLRAIWLGPGTGDYYPVKETLEWLQGRWWGEASFGYHLTNVLLHAAGGVLLWRLLKKLGVRCARFGGLLFVVHPLAVESVAWVDELKNTLSLPLLLLAMILYLDYDGAAPGRLGRGRRYGLSLACFLLAMLSKSSVVMFPLILLLYVGWKRGRIQRRDVLAVAPFLAVSLVLGLVAIRFQAVHGLGGGIAPLDLGGGPTRVARAGLMAAFYFSKSVLPIGLQPLYPRWTTEVSSPFAWLPWLGFAAVFAWLWSRRATWGRHALLGLGWFFLNLVPVLGFIPVSSFRFTWTMDHLAYLPLAGLTGLAAAGLGALETRWAPTKPLSRWLALSAVAAICAALAVESRRYAAIFQSDERFWSFALERNPNAWLAENNLGNLLLERGDTPAAIAHFERALQLNPAYPEAEYNLGLALAGTGRLPEAARHYAASLRLQPANEGAENNLGNALLRMGHAEEAVTHYAEAVRQQPADVQARCNLGVALGRTGRTEEALAQYQEALRLEPESAEAHAGLGNIYARLGRPAEAVGPYQEALRLAPGNADLHFNLAVALAETGRRADAAIQYAEVLRLRPDDADAREGLRRTQP